jgi:hypothetical protein
MGAQSSIAPDHNNPKFEVNQSKVKCDSTNLLEKKNEPEMSIILKNSSNRDQTEQSEESNSDSLSLLTEKLFFKTRKSQSSDSSHSGSSTSLKSQKNVDINPSSKLNIYKPSKINLFKDQSIDEIRERKKLFTDDRFKTHITSIIKDSNEVYATDIFRYFQIHLSEANMIELDSKIKWKRCEVCKFCFIF